MRSRYLLPVLACLLLTTAAVIVPPAGGAAAGASTTSPAAPPGESVIELEDGVTAPIYSYDDAVRETVWVDLGGTLGLPRGLDLDDDGAPDRVAADIIRPREPAQRGQQVAVLMDVSPYYACCGRGNESQKKTYDEAGNPVQFPLFYDNYLVPRGYAVVLVDMAGSARSTGCSDIGGPVDVAAGIAVTNWLNGKANGYTAPRGGEQVAAGWSTGDVAAIGKSNDGAEAMGMAVAGNPAVKTIVPIAGVSSLYAFWNPQGSWNGFRFYDSSSKPPDPGSQEELCLPYTKELNELGGTSGDYTRFWRDRDYTRQVTATHPPVLASQGFGDRNVDPIQFGPWWQELAEHGVTRHAWLHTAGHVDPFDLQRDQWVATLHRWLDRWLWQVPNGIEDEPSIHRETATDTWVDEQQWPAADRNSRIDLGSFAGGPAVREFTDDPSLSADEVWPQDPDQDEPYRIALRGAPATDPQRISGNPSVTLTMSADATKARVGVLLVDYGPSTIRDTVYPAMGVVNTEERTCWGASTAGDSSCYLETTADVTTVQHKVIARGYADAGHARSLVHGRELVPGQRQRMTIDLSAAEHTIQPGHRLGVLIGGSDVLLFADDGSAPPTVTVDLDHSSLSLPIVG